MHDILRTPYFTTRLNCAMITYCICTVHKGDDDDDDDDDTLRISPRLISPPVGVRDEQALTTVQYCTVFLFLWSSGPFLPSPFSTYQKIATVYRRSTSAVAFLQASKRSGSAQAQLQNTVAHKAKNSSVHQC